MAKLLVFSLLFIHKNLAKINFLKISESVVSEYLSNKNMENRSTSHFLTEGIMSYISPKGTPRA